jgi:peptidoglycan/LPS O-acetylase OafA/YrhL
MKNSYIEGIDGLRALAVLSVVLFHLNPAWLPGGFTGVDVFFVISGFVVCASAHSLPHDSFARLCASFYARRVVRIAPALVTCLLLGGVLSTLFVPQAWLSQANNVVGFSAFFGLSNFYLASNAGDYFSPRSEYNPFTHTWSLAVEEQFYLLFPLLIFGVYRPGQAKLRQWSLYVLVALVLLSLLWCAYSTQASPVSAFYLLPSRYWELGTGVLAWLLVRHWRDRGLMLAESWGSAWVWGGLAAILLGFCVADESHFPFPWALLPVCATTALLMMLAVRPQGRSWPEQVLKSAPLTWLGLRSYSLYLWHWPVFVLLRWTVGLETAGLQTLALGLSFVLAALSYRFVEMPVRQASFIQQAARFKVVLVGLSCVTLVALVTGGIFKARPMVSLSVTKDASLWFPYSNARTGHPTNCTVEEVTRPLEQGEITQYQPQACQTPAMSRSLFVIGDSHSTAYTSMLRALSEDEGVQITVLNKSSCPFFNLIIPNDKSTPACQRFTASALAHILANAKPGDVLFMPSLRVPRISNQWVIPDKPLAVYLQDNAPRDAAVAEAIRVLTPYKNAGMVVVLTTPTPVYPAPAFRCSDWFNRDNPVCKLGLSVPRADMDKFLLNGRQAVQSVAQELGESPVWDATPWLCSTTECKSVSDNKPLFFDGDHMTGYTNMMLYPHFRSFLKSLGH